MIGRITEWFGGRSLREKRLILAMLALGSLTIVWVGIIRPVSDGLSFSRERYRDAAIRLGDTRSRVAAVTDLTRSHHRPLTGAFDAAVRASADQAGFTLQTLNGLGADRVQVGIASARPGALFAWIATLERSGFLVGSLATTDNGDHTIAAQMTLMARAA